MVPVSFRSEVGGSGSVTCCQAMEPAPSAVRLCCLGLRVVTAGKSGGLAVEVDLAGRPARCGGVRRSTDPGGVVGHGHDLCVVEVGDLDAPWGAGFGQE